MLNIIPKVDRTHRSIASHTSCLGLHACIIWRSILWENRLHYCTLYCGVLGERWGGATTLEKMAVVANRIDDGWCTIYVLQR